MLENIKETCLLYRVTAATLKVEFVGSGDQDQGEMIIHKFDPYKMNPDGAGTGVNTPDTQSTCREYKRSSDGCFITVARSHMLPSLSFKKFEGEAEITSAQSSMEQIVVFIQSTARGGQGILSSSYRWELVQTVELIPQFDKMITSLAHEVHPEVPLLLPAYNKLMHDLAEKGLDIVDADDEEKVRAMAYGQASNAANSIAAKTGLKVPTVTFDV